MKIIYSCPSCWKSSCHAITIRHPVSEGEAATKTLFGRSRPFLIVSSQDHRDTVHRSIISSANMNSYFWEHKTLLSKDADRLSQIGVTMIKNALLFCPWAKCPKACSVFLRPKPVWSGEGKSVESNEAWPASAPKSLLQGRSGQHRGRTLWSEGRHAECWREKTVWQSGDILLISNLTIRKCQRLYFKA